MSQVRYEPAAIARITIDRAEKRNALNVEVIRGLRDAFAEVKADPAVIVCVLTGAGDKAFCAGADLTGFASDAPEEVQHAVRGELADLFEEMTKLGKPIVARVNGHALAGGFGLMCACDLVVASDTGTFGMPEISMGLWPFIITAVVARRIARGDALDLMMTGRRIDAHEAKRMGAINTVVAADQLDATVAELAGTLASRSPLALRLGKDSFYAVQDLSFREQLDHLHAQLGAILKTEDVGEGVAAFFEKRAPKWKGR